MPQLEVASFCSQVFWLLVAFLVLFLVAKFVIVPNMERVLMSRANHIDSMLEQAKKFTREAELIEQSAIAELESIRVSIKMAEADAISKLRAEAVEAQSRLYAESVAETERIVEKTKKELEEVYENVKAQVPDLVKSAYNRIYQPDGD